VLLILDVYPLRRLGGAIGWWSEPARRVYLEKIPFVLLAAAASAIAVMAQSSVHAAASLAQLGVPGRLAVAAYGLSFYLEKMVAPLNLSPLYELGTVNPWATPFLLSYGVVLALTALALAFRHRLPGLPAAGLAYVVILLPVLGIFQNGPQIAADRYTYLAGMGWAILGGAALLSWWRLLPSLFTGLAACVVLGLGALTWNQVHVWQDSEKLWTHALAIDPESSVAQFGMGNALADQGKPLEAIEHYGQAVRSRPDYADAHDNWGAALAQQGKLAEAIDHYQSALRIMPDYPEAHYNWGLALAQQGKPVEAIDHFRQAVRSRPDYADAYFNLGNTLFQQGKLAEASDHYRQALAIKRDHARAHNNWGIVLARQGKLAEAGDHFQAALHISPDDAEAHNNWGIVLARQGKLAEASDHYQRALRIMPDYPDAHYNWGNLLTQQGKLAEASDHFRQALQIKPDHAAARSGLVRAQRGLGTGKEDGANSRQDAKTQ